MIDIEAKKKEVFLKILQTPEDLKNWVDLFLGIEIPFGHVCEESNSSPGEAIWEAYVTYRDDLYMQNPGYIWMASRDGVKTLAGSILNILLILHFKAEIAHLAAVKKQAEKCLEYTNIFVRKIKPYLEHHGRKIVSDSKSKIQIQNEDGSISFIDVIIANLAGGNSQRATVGSYDELDTLSKQGLVGYKEAQLIPTRKNERGPLSIKYSTRKFAFGIFEREIQEIGATGEQLKQWNIVDITEKCQNSRSKKDSGNVHIRYARKKLPLKIYQKEEIEALPLLEREEFQEIKLYDGCLSCPLASVCKGRLTERPESAKATRRSIYRSIDFTIGQFRKIKDPEMAEAQLLCWKPTTLGLVYPRFNPTIGENLINIPEAYELVTGEKKIDASMDDLVAALHKHEAKVYAGVDWGFTKNSVIIALAVLAGGSSIVLDTFASPGLETHDFADIAVTYGERYGIQKWFCDTANPSGIKTFKKKGLSCPEFKKDILGGISAVRGEIITTTGDRKLKVLNVETNRNTILDMFKLHHFLLDNAGNVTSVPDDGDFADIGDALRYVGQNIFGPKAAHKVLVSTHSDGAPAQPLRTPGEQIRHEINKLVEKAPETDSSSLKKKSGLFWDF